MSKQRVSIRITNNQALVLQEMCEAYDTSISMLVRTILGSWLTEHEEDIERGIMRKRREQHESDNK